MKKLLLLTLILLLSSSLFAAPTKEDISNLSGGISIVQVKQSIGEPNRCKKLDSGWMFIYKVLNTEGLINEFHLYFIGENLNSVIEYNGTKEGIYIVGPYYSPEDSIKLINNKTNTIENENIVFVQTGYILTDAEQKQKSIANAHKHMGFYIFTDNEPISEYTIIDRVKVSVSWSGEYEGVRNHLLKKVLKSYPDASGVILDLTNGGSDWATVIKFTNNNEQKEWGYARVHTFNGYYVFCDCEPVNSYYIIGRSKSAFAGSGQNDSVKANLIKKALKDCPQAQGIILDFHKGGTDRGVIIKF